MKILAISGSIRSESSNSALLKSIHKILGANCDWVDFAIADLPFFDPHMQFGAEVPLTVQSFRQLVINNDYLIISTPEYAHGIPGILKNALEWLVCEETIGKKVIIFVATPSGGDYVKEYLIETLTTMDMKTSREMSFVLQTARRDISSNGDILNQSLNSSIIEFLKKMGLLKN